MNFCRLRITAARLSILFSSFLLGGCALTIENAPANIAQSAAPKAQRAQPPKDIVGENLIALSFSGGGLRASAFSYGVLRAIEDAGTSSDDLLDDIGFISSVSGGSLTAAYFGLNGKQTLTDFPSKVLFQDMERGLRLSAFAPTNFIRLLRGGLNDRTNLSDWMDKRIFKGATFSTLYERRRPDVWINASDLFNRTPFPFIPPLFNALCSDIGSFSIAEAVAASMAVPILFAPTLLKTYPEGCTDKAATWETSALNNPSASKTLHAAAQAYSAYRDPSRMRYVKLVDGGITDNFGLSSILIGRSASRTAYGPFTARDAVKLKRMLFLVVDAGRGPSGDWALQADGPTGAEIAIAATDSAVDSAARTAFDSFRTMMSEWERDVIEFRCKLNQDDVLRLRGTLDKWNCKDVQFDVGLVSFSDLGLAREKQLNAIPTRLYLPKADIETAIEAGRDAAQSNAALRLYAKQRVPMSERMPINKP